ncbi:MAG TPA: hypothetical protein VFH17_02045 [Coriobacteriia bacterium]|nr:hypothetical protein [Coriobacteriia bacterium]
MGRRITGAVLTGAIALAFATPVMPAAAAEPAPRVVVVLAPYLQLSDIDPDVAPAIHRLAEQGAVGNINLRNRSRIAAGPPPLQGALVFSSGSWAAADRLAPQPHDVDEYYEGGSASDAYERMTGEDATGYDVVFLGLPRTVRLNDGAEALAIRLGALGQAIRDAGGSTAAIGNSDAGFEVRGVWRNRPAAAVAMDESGRVVLGSVSTALLRNDSDSPFGFATDLEAFAAEHERVRVALDEAGGPSLIVLDAGDPHRAQEVAIDVSPGVAEVHRLAAVRTLDAIVALAADALPPGGTLMVVPQVLAETPGAVTGLGPMIVYGEGWSGYLSSSSTHRRGLVTNLDVPATVLAALGVERPVEMLGNAMVSDGVRKPLVQRVVTLADANATAIAVDTAKPVVVNGFIAVTTLLLLGCTLVLLRARRWQRRDMCLWSSIGRRLLLLVLAVPPASLLMFVIDRLPSTAAEAYLAFFAALGVVFVAGLALEFLGPRVPIVFLSMLAVTVIIIDQVMGAPLSFTSFLGYSPLLAARYYGLGNEGAAILFGAAVTGFALLLDEYRTARWARLAGRWGLPAFAAVVTVVAAAPVLGANVAVAAWAVAGFAALWAIHNRVRFDWKLVVSALLVTVLLIAAFSAIDLRAGAESRSHLARAWESLSKGGVSELWLIIARKAETNIRVLMHTNWSYVLVAVLAFLGFMRWRPQGDFAAVLSENPAFSAGMTACLIGGAVAYVTEDSGIVIPALAMVYVGVAIVHLMLSRLPRAAGGEAGDAEEC